MAVVSDRSEGLRCAKHVCDLGRHGVRRVIAANEHSLTVETTADVQARIASISLHTGSVTFSRTQLPVLKGESTFAGTRWVRVRNSRRSTSNFSADLQWQDEVDGRVYDACIVGETVRAAECPHSSDLLFVATRTHPITGGGAVYCFCRGKLLWRFEPPQVVVYPVLMASPDKPQVRAYPFRMRASQDGRRIGFSFLNYFYMLDAEGQLLSIHDVAAALEQELGHVRMAHPEPQHSEFHIAGQNVTFSCNTTLERETYEHPCVQSVAVSEDGRLWLVSAKNVLVWITSEGKIANIKELPFGMRSRIGDMGAVLRTEVSAAGDIVVSGVCGEGLAVLVNGQYSSAYRCDLRGDIWEYNDRRRWVALKQWSVPDVAVYDLSWQEVASIRLNPEVRQFRVSEDGHFLFGLGAANPVFLIASPGC